jgi:hypothetical protein
MKKCVLLVMTNVIEGKEREFNEWYSSTHIHDILKVAGVVSAQRFQCRAEKGAFGFLALYELETDDPEGVVAEIRKRDRNGTHSMSAAVDRKNLFAELFESITDRISSNAHSD